MDQVLWEIFHLILLEQLIYFVLSTLLLVEEVEYQRNIGDELQKTF